MTPDSAPEAAESPQPPTFDSLGLSPEVLRALTEVGYEHPTPVQHATYAPAVEGEDIIVQARTGTGKTAAFGIPLVDRIVSQDHGAQALVLAPTRELALQSARELSRLGQYRGVQTVAIYGGAPMGAQIRDLERGAQIVSGTPGRVLDHLRRGTLDADGLRILVLDEMDEMLSMGFAKELGAILELIPDESQRQTMCFSATVDGAVRRHAMRYMRNPRLVSLSSDAVGAEQISHAVYMVSGTNRSGDLVQVLNVEDPETAIIFCNMRAETERVAADLKKAGFNADWLNGDLPQRERERIMARTREGKLRYLVATDVAARGIDVSHLTHVINYSFPESGATYVHRTGRTGRAGRTGAAISLVSPQELGRLYYLRLEYKITPIERSLPSAGENRTRQELDRLKLLEQSIERLPSGDELALARRLLTHPDAEAILGGLLRAFFGADETPEEVDARAAQARRDRRAAAVAPPRSERRPRRERRPREKYDRVSRDNRSDREGPRPDTFALEGEAASAEREDTRNGLEARENKDARRSSQPRGEQREARDSNGQGGAARRNRRERSERDRSERSERDRSERSERDRSERSDRDRSERSERDRSERSDRDRNERDRSERDRSERSERERSNRTPEVPAPRPPAPSAWDDADIPVAASTASYPQGENEGDEEPKRRRRNRRRRRKTDDNGAPEQHSTTAAPSSLQNEQDAAPPRRSTRPITDSVLLDESERPQTHRSAATRPPKRRSDDGMLDVDAPGFEPNDDRPGATVFLNVGRRDGVRVGEIAKLMRETCELGQENVGRIRMRDRYTYVDVPEQLVDAVVKRLGDVSLHNRPLDPERAKVTRS